LGTPNRVFNCFIPPELAYKRIFFIRHYLVNG
jgi:hypothetical protein